MVVLRLLGLFLDLLLLPLRLLLRLVRGAHVTPDGAWLTITLDGPVVDIVGKPRFWQVRAQKAVSLHLLAEVIEHASRDPRVKGIVVTMRSMSAGMATATSLRALLARFRTAGKEVVVHLPMGGDTKEVYVASVASKVLLGPTTQLAPLGFRSSSPYVKRALDHAGVEPQVFACGEFKSAGESLVRDSMSPAQRAQLERLLETFHAMTADAIAEGRKMSREKAEAVIDEAPYFGRAAVDAGLADDLAYDDEVPSRIGVREDDQDALMIDAADYLARTKRRFFRRIKKPPVIAVVPMHGTIAHASGPFGGLSTDERLTRAVRAVRRDRRVRGVILHIDSGGGSALASDLMHHEIEQLAREKPVIACMANVAASGGYYIAAPCKKIVAEPTTVTGSIGVVAARLSLDPLLARLGVVIETVEKGKHAKLLAPMGALDEDSRATIMRELDATYRSFVGVVAKGRKRADEEIEKLARGRVYTGKDAKDVGLVDELGGFDVAVKEVKQLVDARVRDRLEVVLVRTPRNAVPFPPLPKDGDERGDDEKKKRTLLYSLVTSLLPARDRMLLDLAATGERVLFVSPIVET